jgi:regulator of sigma E protease
MYFAEMFFYYVIVTCLVLTVVVFVHEMGHYLMARRFGVRIEAFSIGFGREIFGVTDKRGMRWKICLFPLGGFVVMHGEMPPFVNAQVQFTQAYKNGALWTRPNGQRSLIALGGPLANFICAFLIMTGVFLFHGKEIASPMINAVEIGAGADRSGILVGDELVRVNHVDVPESFEDIKELTKNSGEALDVVVRRGLEVLDFNISLSVMKDEGDFGEDTSRKVMGIILGNGLWSLEAINSVDGIPTGGDKDVARSLILSRLGKDMVVNFGLVKKEGDEPPKDYRLRLDPKNNQALFDPEHVNYGSLFYGDFEKTRTKALGVFDSSIESIRFSWMAIRKTCGVLYQMVVGKKDTGDLGGVVKIGEMAGGTMRQADILGYSIFFRLLAILSVNIGFLNLLPLPMLDGGHLMFNGYEAVRGKPPTPKVKAYMMAGSVGFVFAFMILVNFRDILEIFS